LRKVELTKRTVIRPSKDSTKYHPPLVTESVLAIAAVKVPDVSTNVVRAWTVTTGIVNVGAQPEDRTTGWLASMVLVENPNEKSDGQLVVLVSLKISNTLAEQTSTDEEDQVGHDDEEGGQSCLRESADDRCEWEWK